VRAEHGDRLSRLHEQCLVVLELAQRADDGVERFPAARGAAGAAVHDQFVGTLGDVRIEIVHEHAQGSLLRPPFTREDGAARGSNHARSDRHCGDGVRPGSPGKSQL
jgi:hypothetical protein